MLRVIIDYEFLGTLIELAFIEEYDFIEFISHQLANSQIELSLIHVIGEWLLDTLPETRKVNHLSL